MSLAFNLSSKQLRRAADLRERMDKLEKQLAAILTSTSESPAKAAAKPAKSPKRRGKMSKQARARQSLMMKKRWAKAKAAGRKSL